MDDYELLKQLAKGGQGTTHVAKKRSTGSRLVVKQTQCENVRTGNDALREAKTLQVSQQYKQLYSIVSGRYPSIEKFHKCLIHRKATK